MRLLCAHIHCQQHEHSLRIQQFSDMPVRILCCRMSDVLVGTDKKNPALSASDEDKDPSTLWTGTRTHSHTRLALGCAKSPTSVVCNRQEHFVFFPIQSSWMYKMDLSKEKENLGLHC